MIKLTRTFLFLVVFFTLVSCTSSKRASSVWSNIDILTSAASNQSQEVSEIIDFAKSSPFTFKDTNRLYEVLLSQYGEDIAEFITEGMSTESVPVALMIGALSKFDYLEDLDWKLCYSPGEMLFSFKRLSAANGGPFLKTRQETKLEQKLLLIKDLNERCRKTWVELSKVAKVNGKELLVIRDNSDSIIYFMVDASLYKKVVGLRLDSETVVVSEYY